MQGLALRHSTTGSADHAPTRPVWPQATVRLGNQAHLRRLQAKLRVGAVNDPLEHEADRVADTVMRSAGPATVQRKCSGCEEEEKPVRRQAETTSSVDGAEAPPAVHDTLASSGAPLDAGTSAFMSERMGHDFSGVRIHTGAKADASAKAVNANAYTVGRDVVFAAGQYQPHAPLGQRLIAHELAHVVQQGAASAPTALRRDGPSGPDAPLKEAKKEDATGAVEGGLKTIADAASKDEKLKAFGLDLAKQYALPIWNGASDADKAAMVVGGTAIVGTGLTALLANPNGRKILDGVNFLAPLSLVPYATLSGFSFDLPKTKTDPLGLHFSFKADDLLELAHDKLSFVPPLSASLDFTLSVSPNGKVTTPSALANFTVAPGITVAGGFGVASDLSKMTTSGDGQLAPYKDFPQPAQAAPPGGVVGYVGVDLLKAHILPPAVRSALGGSAK